MSASLDSTPDSHHVRHMHDQRINRLDPDDNFCGLTQYTDTPSVYAPTYFSPGPAFSPRDRLNDPHMSTIDMESDPRFSLAISQSDDTSHDDDETHSFEEDDDDGPKTGDESDSRLSYLGPKMRIHTRAPWETEAGIAEEDEDALDSPKHHAFPFSFGGRGHSSTGSSSPRPSLSFGRPSGDSARSHIMPKRSFDTINSQLSSKGALYALAQESLSSASLARSNPPLQKDSLFGKISSFGRARGNSSPSLPPALLPTRSHLSSGVPSHHRNPLDNGSQIDYDPFAANASHYAGHASRPQSPAVEESIHPYANPDLMTTEPSSRSTGYISPLPSTPPIRNDSTVTVTQKVDLNTPTASRNSLSSTAGAHKHRVSSIHGREISSPVAVQGSSLPPDMAPGIESQAGALGHLPGWKDKSVPPAFNLISLEEARALRNKPQPQPPTPVDESTPMQSAANLLSHSTSTLRTTVTEDSASVINQEPSPTGRTRGRTISAGTKAKNAFHSIVGSVMTERRDPEPSITPTQSTPTSQLPKQVKHKKSGFMRLFNGSMKEKEPDAAPPPVPSASNASDIASLNVKRVVSRIPVPSYNLPHSEPPLPPSPPPAGSAKRAPPALSINTVSSNPQRRDIEDQNDRQATTSSLYAPKPWSSSDQPPLSAPPDMTGFPTLKLRPVSSLFSSGFEHIVPDLATSSDFDTPSSSSPHGPVSPITPGKTDPVLRPGSTLQSTTPNSELASSRRRVTELEMQVHNLQIELEGLRSRQHDHGGPYCHTCGRGRDSSPGVRDESLSSTSSSSSGSGGIAHASVINRPRAKTSSRFVNAVA
ncbi:hypothetical protein NMY22_g1307 [Coprinellus aureogranulatus]|nr:hypothetical protein NMY22_g1307 [Coprinellus aureogranulatus]